MVCSTAGGEMSLLEAIKAGKLAQVRAMIASGANLRETDNVGCFTALGLAANLGRIEIVRALLDAGVAADDSATACALDGAALGGQVEAARVLVEAGAPLDWQNETGMTPLMQAARVGQFAVVRYLVESGADLDRRDWESRYAPRRSALDYAVEEGYPEIAEYLLARGARFEPDDYIDESGAVSKEAGELIERARRNRDVKELPENRPDGYRMATHAPPGGATHVPGIECQRSGFVSVWVGSFPCVEAAEVYFGIPDEIGVYLPPEGFAQDLGVEDRLLERLEVNFERTAPRPLEDLLMDAPFAGMFRDQAVEAARRQGIATAPGIVLVYDFDYRAKRGWKRAVGPLTFIGTFAFREMPEAEAPQPRRDPRIEIREIADDVL